MSGGSFGATLCATSLVAGCATAAKPCCEAHAGDRYRTAVCVAQSPTADKVVHDLVAIDRGDTRQRWRSFHDDRVLVVTWTDWSGYEKVARDEPLVLRRDVWVTVVPEVRRFCAPQPAEARERRIAEHLGLPHPVGRWFFAEMWVRPRDLFRPCPDPEITDRECSLDFPKDVDPDHRAWIERRRSESYQPHKDHPWTQLGYTYDWGDTGHAVGASEFVVRKGADVVVNATATAEEYCVAEQGPPPARAQTSR